MKWKLSTAFFPTTDLTQVCKQHLMALASTPLSTSAARCATLSSGEQRIISGMVLKGSKVKALFRQKSESCSTGVCEGSRSVAPWCHAVLSCCCLLWCFCHLILCLSCDKKYDNEVTGFDYKIHLLEGLRGSLLLCHSPFQNCHCLKKVIFIFRLCYQIDNTDFLA